MEILKKMIKELEDAKQITIPEFVEEWEECNAWTSLNQAGPLSKNNGTCRISFDKETMSISFILTVCYEFEKDIAFLLEGCDEFGIMINHIAITVNNNSELSCSNLSKKHEWTRQPVDITDTINKVLPGYLDEIFTKWAEKVKPSFEAAIERALKNSKNNCT